MKINIRTFWAHRLQISTHIAMCSVSYTRREHIINININITAESNQLMNQSTYQSIKQSTYQSIQSIISINQSNDISFNQSISISITQSVSLPINIYTNQTTWDTPHHNQIYFTKKVFICLKILRITSASHVAC